MRIWISSHVCVVESLYACLFLFGRTVESLREQISSLQDHHLWLGKKHQKLREYLLNNWLNEAMLKVLQ